MNVWATAVGNPQSQALASENSRPESRKYFTENCKDLPFDAEIPTPQDIPSFCKRIPQVTATFNGARGTLGFPS